MKDTGRGKTIPVLTFTGLIGKIIKYELVRLPWLNGYNKLLLRESRGIPQREKMKNNFQFESILKNAKGDNKAFPKLGNVLMLPNQKNL